MIVAANRVPITKGYEQEFEKRFERRLVRWIRHRDLSEMRSYGPSWAITTSS